MARARPEPASAAPRGASPLLVALVVIAGAVLMALEMLGSRMLAPYFGSSVFVWGSLIGVFLASLSLGYWAGGHLADRRPSFALLSALALASAALIFASWPLTPPVCRALVDGGMGDRLGPLLASLAIFFLPSVLLGMVSPFAIRLSAKSLGNIGMQAGRLYALSTLGSILGTFATTFVLIPALPVRLILVVLGAALAVVPAVVLATSRRGAAPLAGGAATLAILAYVAGSAHGASLKPGEKLVYEGSSAYHQVAVVDDEQGHRFLKFDDFYESGISLQPPYEGSFPYTGLFHAGPLLAPEPKRALFLGAGGGIGPRAFAAAYPSLARIDVVDVDPLVLDLARRYFFLAEEGPIRVHADDARMFLRGVTEPYDVVVLDAFTIGGRIPFHLATREFFAEIAEHLAPGGALVMNLNSAVAGPKSEIYASLAATMAAAFGDVAAFPLFFPGEDPSSRRSREATRNILLAAVRGGLPAADTLRERADRSPRREARWVAGLLANHVPRGEVLTDEHAPIETMEF